jgi:hypothetical protein
MIDEKTGGLNYWDSLNYLNYWENKKDINHVLYTIDL